MRYISTRGYMGDDGQGVGFIDAMLDGLAPDGGLYLPQTYPTFTAQDLDRFANLSFVELAEEIILPFVAPDLNREQLRALLKKAYSTFSIPEITPLKKLDEDNYLLELFHGPTLAFKDVALQLLGGLLDFALADKNKQVTVLGATSGDTGPAAIEGLKGVNNSRIFMLFPHNRVSHVQRKQMTTTGAANVYPIAIDGTFDDCQKLVKELFNDKKFKEQQNLTAVNSISWARLLPQMVYYFHAWGRLNKKPLAFSVPTGNFGDVFAGFAAQKCGLPIEKLIIANNDNDIVTRFVSNGDYSIKDVIATQSPSIDISIASNFERYLFEVMGRDSAALRQTMDSFANSGKLPTLSKPQMAQVRNTFAAFSANETEITATIKAAWQGHGILLDPHTAVGLYATREYQKTTDALVVTLATAHPAKFPDAVEKATNQRPDLPLELRHILAATEDSSLVDNSAEQLKNFILSQS